MATTDEIKQQVRYRCSLTELEREYLALKAQPATTGADQSPKELCRLEKLMKAWQGIQRLDADDQKSFFVLGGFHGEPFRGAGWGNNAYWGGYCHHGNILFPLWHRVYMLKLEEALQSIEGCEDVMLPYWDQTDSAVLEDGLNNGTHIIPWSLTAQKFQFLDGTEIPNPLYSYTIPKNIVDSISGDDPNYSKPKGYTTVRYPLSGLVGSESEEDATTNHNDLYSNERENVRILNDNVLNWLTAYIILPKSAIDSSVKPGSPEDVPTKYPTNVMKKYIDCLKAPNYTVFSNATSAQQWNAERMEMNPAPGTTSSFVPVVPLESPHNDLHLAVGGYEAQTFDYSPIEGANGDMGENDTAALDPIFYFHHCNIDRMFWVWQKIHGCTGTGSLEVISGYPGTNSVDNQGPTPGVVPNSWLTLDTPLEPFYNEKEKRMYTSQDCVDIINQLNYNYTHGSLDPFYDGLQAEAVLPDAAEAAPVSTNVLTVSGINKASKRGSFTVSAYIMVDGKKKRLGTESVLNRWNTQGCANCQIHQEVKAFFKLPQPSAATAANAFLQNQQLSSDLLVELKGRNGLHLVSSPITVTYSPVPPQQEFTSDLAATDPQVSSPVMVTAAIAAPGNKVSFLSVNKSAPRSRFSVIRQLFYKKGKEKSGTEASFGVHIQ